MVETPDSLATRTQYAGRLLIGRDAPRDPDQGIEILRSNAKDGCADSATLLATLSGAGAWVPQNWDAAFDYLEQAAVLGGVSARGQLSVLGRARLADSDDP